MRSSRAAYLGELSYGDSDEVFTLGKPEEAIPESPASVLGIRPSPEPRTLRAHLQALTALVANATEAYSATIFMANNETRMLKVCSTHTLSRDYITDAEIAFGAGLVGWTAENKVRISVCPFQHDSRTLLYYSADQGLKSFIAIPIIDSKESLLGVLCCDSKKSYAFAKLTEKVLHDCAHQAALLFELHSELESSRAKRPTSPSAFSSVVESLRRCESEEELLSSACAIPQEAVTREALVIITTADRGVGQGAYYSVSRESRFNHRLLELVCKHKKIICPDRSVHVTSSDDLDQRSFLSVPFRVLGKEAGSFNVLSRKEQAFQAGEIAVLEKLAAIVGERLEHIRLRDSLGNRSNQASLLSWRQFEAKAGRLLDEAACNKQNLALIRIVLRGLSDIEDIAGVDASCTIAEKTARIIEQIAGAESASCCLYGGQFLILGDQSDISGTQRKLNTLLNRMQIETEHTRRLPEGLKLNQLLQQSTTASVARFPQDGSSLADLIARTNTAQTDSSWQQKSLEVTANAGSWTE